MWNSVIVVNSDHKINYSWHHLMHPYSVLHAYHLLQKQAVHCFLLTACLRWSSLSAATIGSSFFRWYAIRWLMLSNNMSLVRTCVASTTKQQLWMCKVFFCWLHVGPVLLSAILTTPSGSTSRRCLGRPQCIPVSTYWPGLVVLSRTRKSPSRMRSLSASLLLRRLWYHASLRSCSSFGATGALRRGGLGHWSSRTWVPPAAAVVEDPAAPAHASWSFRASSKGP